MSESQSGPGPYGGVPQPPQQPPYPQDPSYPQYPQGPLYPQQPQGPAGPSSAEPRSRVGLIVVSVLATLALIATGTAVYLVLRPDTAAASEVFLETADQPGADPFTTEVAVPPLPATTAPITTTTSAAPTTSGNVTAVVSTSGGQPGLYGGTQNNASCDPKQLVTFLQANPAKASAFVQALNRDPSLRWSGGTQVQTTQIAAYVNELTPLTLTRDTRVTNYGYANGQPTPRQAVLQRGTAVLIDKYGTPRVKCGCGNPLTTPIPVSGTPRYQGPQWSGWSPTTVVVVQQTTVVINTFVVVNLSGPGYLDRPSGSTGDRDTVSSYTPGGTSATTSPSTGPSSSATTTPTTTASTAASTAPPTSSTAPVSTLPAADFCAVYKSLDAKWSNVQTDTPEVRRQLADDFATLAAAAPAEVKADMDVLNNWLRPMLLSGNLDLGSEPPEVAAAVTRVEAYLQRVCGVS
jgi:hypothetical protein